MHKRTRRTCCCEGIDASGDITPATGEIDDCRGDVDEPSDAGKMRFPGESEGQGDEELLMGKSRLFRCSCRSLVCLK